MLDTSSGVVAPIIILKNIYYKCLLDLIIYLIKFNKLKKGLNNFFYI